MVIPGGYVTFGFTFLISIIGLWELYRVIGVQKSGIMIIGVLGVSAYYASLLVAHAVNLPITFAVAIMIILLFVYVFTYPKYNISQIAIAFFGIFYVAVMISCVYLTRTDVRNGAFLVWLIFIVAWGTDTCAYFFGCAFGKHKMAPVLSPKKSIEGAVGGVVGAMIFTLLFCILFRVQIEAGWRKTLAFTLIAGVGSVVSMVGDLAASAIKRNYDIKDYGNLIPGHGGILDRFDSVIITAPIFYYMIKIFLP